MERDSRSKQRYEQNKREVYRLYGISPDQRKNYSIHHVIFCSDYLAGRTASNFNPDNKGNLIPLPKKKHEKFHQEVDRVEGKIGNTKDLTRLKGYHKVFK